MSIREKHYFWFNANPNIWGFHNIFVGNEEDITLYDNGRKRNYYNAFCAAKEGDIVLGYQTGIPRKIIAICKVSRSAANPEDHSSAIYIRKILDIPNGVSKDELREKNLSGIMPLKAEKGTFFSIDKNSYKTIIDVIEEHNPNLLVEIRDFSSYSLYDRIEHLTDQEAYEYAKEKGSLFMGWSIPLGKKYSTKQLKDELQLKGIKYSAFENESQRDKSRFLILGLPDGGPRQYPKFTYRDSDDIFQYSCIGIYSEIKDNNERQLFDYCDFEKWVHLLYFNAKEKLYEYVGIVEFNYDYAVKIDEPGDYCKIVFSGKLIYGDMKNKSSVSPLLGFTVDSVVFDHSFDRLIDVIDKKQSEKDYGTKDIGFSVGYMREQEWYKRELFNKAQIILDIPSWKKDMIGSSVLYKKVLEVMNIRLEETGKPQNLVSWREIEYIEEIFKVNPYESEEILYELYTGNNEESEQKAFYDAVKCFGGRFPLISFLFFIKDKDRFAVCKPQKFKERFSVIGMESGCFGKCTWENYRIYISMLEYVKEYIVPVFGDDTELLDAHSFVWMLWHLKDNEKDEKIIHEIEEGTENLLGRERERVIKGRVNQGVFRDRLLARYNKCCLCQVNDKSFLIASHIKPWSESEDDEKLDPDNGLLLCPNHDKAFDGAYITFDDNGKIKISDELSEENRIFLNIREEMHIDMNERRRKFIKFHREELFEDVSVDNE